MTEWGTLLLHAVAQSAMYFPEARVSFEMPLGSARKSNLRHRGDGGIKCECYSPHDAKK